MNNRLYIRFLCILICAVLLIPVIATAAETTKVTAHLLRLREKPSTDSDVIDAFPKGTSVTILKKGTEWTKVKVRGKTGYMMTKMLAYGKKYITEQNGSSDETTSTSTEEKTEKKTSTKVKSGTTMYVEKGVRLNLRAEADSSSEILASFRGGTAVKVLRYGKYWCYVEVKGMEGYMGTDYLHTEKQK